MLLIPFFRTFFVQNEHFGKLVLSGEALLNYVMWYRVLDPPSAKNWDAFVSELKPGRGLRRKLKTFQMTGTAAGKGTKLLLDGLGDFAPETNE